MKKVLALLMVMVLAGCAALAEGTFTPTMFLGSRGLVVMDRNQMGGEQTEDGFERLGDVSVCVYGMSNTGDVIAFTENGTSYFAFNMMAAFSGEPSDLSQVYADFCRAYEFDFYAAGGDGVSDEVGYIHGSNFPIDEYEADGGEVGLLCTSLDSYLEAVAELAANRPAPEPTAEPSMDGN